MEYPNFSKEKKLWKQGFECVVGLDEVGRGPLAGPVVAVAVVINLKHEIRNPKHDPKGTPITKIKNQKHISDFVLRISDLKIRDSKQLSQKQREYLFKVLTRHPDVEWGIGIVSEKVIDKINILEATKLAMQKAVNALTLITHGREPLKLGYFLLIDGNFLLDFNEVATQPKEYPSFGTPKQKSIVKGDQKVLSISIASIIAKVTRDKIMVEMHKKYPQYGFDKHKGYGTALHMEMIKKYGPCKIHRKSFYPISTFI